MHLYPPVSVLLLLLGLIARSRMAIVTAGLSLIGSAVMVAPYYVPDFRTASSDCASFKIFHINAKVGWKKNYDPAVALAVKSDADVIAVSELDRELRNKLIKALPNYPHSVLTTKCGGIALFSKQPFAFSQLRYSGPKERPRILATVMIGKREVLLLAAHPFIPGEYLKWRNDEYRQWADEITEATSRTKPAILVGDLNCSAWSPYMRDFLEKAAMRDSSLGLGISPTWPADVLALIPIDHCLISKDFIVSKREVGPGYGSDHLPLSVTLLLPHAN